MRVDRAPRDVLQIVHQRVGPFREQRDDFLGYPADPRVRNHVAGEWLACAALTGQRVVDDSGRQQRREVAQRRRFGLGAGVARDEGQGVSQHPRPRSRCLAAQELRSGQSGDVAQVGGQER